MHCVIALQYPQGERLLKFSTVASQLHPRTRTGKFTELDTKQFACAFSWIARTSSSEIAPANFTMGLSTTSWIDIFPGVPCVPTASVRPSRGPHRTTHQAAF